MALALTSELLSQPATLLRVDEDTKPAPLATTRQTLKMRSGLLGSPELVSFFDSLARLGSSQDAVHVVHFGDSHTAADDLTGALRKLLMDRFGNGGSGFSFAGRPFPGYRRFDAQAGGSPGWRTVGLPIGSGDSYLGLGGLGISTNRASESVYIETSCDKLEIHFLQQTDGGELALYDQDARITTFSTAGPAGPGIFSAPCSAGPHKFYLRTLEARPVRLFGWVADRSRGITYEALGINGTEASIMLRWDVPMLTTYLRSRNPRLIVLAYGTNEALHSQGRADEYGKMFSAVLRRLRLASPSAAILVLGPPDSWVTSRANTYRFPGLDDVIRAQERACVENSCAFWNTMDRMGGRGSMPRWVGGGLAQPDHVHFTPAGYRKLAQTLFDDLLVEYERFLVVRQSILYSDVTNRVRHLR